MKNKSRFTSVIRGTAARFPWLMAGLVFAVAGSVAFALVPPLVLEKIVDGLAAGAEPAFSLALLYFAALALSGLFDALKEMLITVFGQKITHRVRGEMCTKLSRLPASYFAKSEPGVTVSRFVNDVDTVEDLFASGIIGMFVDACKVAGILAVIFVKSTGLGVLMLAVTPLLFLFTRSVQKRTLSAQLQNRAAVGKVSNHVPETIRNIRMIHVFRKEKYMEDKYDQRIEESYQAVEKTNFYDAVYSPVILLISSVIIAVMMVLAATGGPMQTFFGMSVGTAVAVIAYVGKVFDPLENIGMEIQSIQSAVAGVRRVREFLDEPERPETDPSLTAEKLLSSAEDAVRLENVDFAYNAAEPVLRGLSFSVRSGEAVTLAGRTGAGKTTVFKLLLGFYSPQSGRVRIYGADADRIPDAEKRKLFGCVEQSFRPLPGSVGEQISACGCTLTQADVEKAARLAGIHEVIAALPQGYATPYADSLFSQGQRQLLAVARAVAADPAVLLLDEITANLDSATEAGVLSALKKASARRTVLSISHRLYEETGSRLIEIDGSRGENQDSAGQAVTD